MNSNKLIIDGDISKISDLQFKDIYYAHKQAVKIRAKNKINVMTYQGQYLTVTIRVTERKIYHASWNE